MKQKTYNFEIIEELKAIVDVVINTEDYKNAKSVLIQLYNPRVDFDEEQAVELLSQNCSKAIVTGMTMACIAEEKYDLAKDTISISFSFFEKTSLSVFEYDLEYVSMFEAGRDFNKNLDLLMDVKCAQIFYVTNYTSLNSFTHEVRHKKLPIFGAKAGRNIRILNEAHIYGKKVYKNAAIAVVFQSKDLSIFMKNNLGWQEIGAEMVITKVDGDKIASEIDGKPATEVYSKYLSVQPDKYFVQNVSEFPMVLHRGSQRVARVPMAYRDNGAIVFNSEVQQGAHFRLAYAIPARLLAISAKAAATLENFKPEGVFLYECGNRHRFLRQQYKEELDLFKEVSSELSFTIGYGEIFSTPNCACDDLNGAIVVVGLSENAQGEDVFIVNDDAESDLLEQQIRLDQGQSEIPLVDRVLAFLDSTSKELDSINKELGHIAYTDQLTQVYNRWELEKKLDEAIMLGKQGKKYALLFFDIDHFKNVNDTYGHDMGDVVLKGLVNIVRENLKDGHVFGRWGGEEFLYLLPDVDEKQAVEYGEFLRNKISEACFVMIRHVTVSIGVTVYNSSDDVNSFVKRADEALYFAKENGRNQVAIK